MKTVFINSMVAHVWAQQSQAEGRGSSFYFIWDTIYSYGAHFPIARWVKRKDGATCVLFTTDTYGQSTSKHISYTRHAIPSGVPVFHVADVTNASHAGKVEALTEYQKRIDDAVLKAARARTSAQWHMERATELANEANDFAAWFKLRQRVKVPEFTPEFIAAVKAKAAKHMQAQRKANEERARAQALLMASAVTEWRAGRSVPPAWAMYACSGATILRIKGDNVQTSRGAEVPIAHAARLWKVIQRVMKSGVPYARNGHTEHVGEFTVNTIAVNGDITAGCHFIKYAEIERIAHELKLEGAKS